MNEILPIANCRLPIIKTPGVAPLLSLMSLLAIAPGCVSYTRTAPDGSRVSASGLFMKVAAIEASEVSTNGVSRKLAVRELSPDAQAIEAVAAGVARGLAEGAK